ncbi:MAG: insulinase family protein [Nanoarchaeota archaeon]|nr:insulinase family protein [Nanoarchaeota archaeon]
MGLKKDFKRVLLKNGLTILFEKRNLPLVSIGIAVKSGGINESSSEKGISHFIEHLLYKGTPKRNALQIAEEIEKRGGELNGFTEEEVTAYWCKIPSNHAETGFEVLFDMVKNPLFMEEEIEKERKVIFEEIKMRKDNPQLYVLDKIQNFLYDSPLGEDLIGTYETMNSIKREDILKRFRQIYHPNNIIISVVGDYDFGKLKRIVKKSFGNSKGSVPKFRIKERNESKIEKRKGIDQANLIFAFHSPLANGKDSYAAEILMNYMAGGMSSRLFSEIREKRNLAYAVKGQVNIRRDYSYSVVYVGSSGKNVGEIKKIILEEFKKASKNFTSENLKRAKEQLIGNYRISMEDSEVQMTRLIFHELEGDASKFYDFEKNISKVKLSEVQKLASKVKEGNYSFFALVPDKV